MSAAELGKGINQALESSHHSVAHPVRWKGWAAPRLASNGVKSEATFQKHASLVSVLTDGRKATFTPHRNGGANGPDKGFLPINEYAEQVNATTHEVYGQTALQVFERCT